MASKKDDEAKQAELEAERASLQNSFLSAVLVPKEFMEEEDLPISPAVHIDESAEPLAPIRSKSSQIVPEPIPEPPKPQAPLKPSNLGAAESLMSGMMPSAKSETKPQKPTEASPTQQDNENANPDKQSSDPMSSLLGGSKSSEEENPEPPKQSAPHQSVSSPEPAPNASKDEDLEKPNTKKGGVFSKAKSLFSTITNKEKKE